MHRLQFGHREASIIFVSKFIYRSRSQAASPAVQGWPPAPAPPSPVPAAAPPCRSRRCCPPSAAA